MLGLLRQVLYPVLMFVTVFRTLLVRVRPNVLLIFKPYDSSDDSAPNSRGMIWHGTPRCIPWSALVTGIPGRAVFRRDRASFDICFGHYYRCCIRSFLRVVVLCLLRRLCKLGVIMQCR